MLVSCLLGWVTCVLCTTLNFDWFVLLALDLLVCYVDGLGARVLVLLRGRCVLVFFLLGGCVMFG